MTASRTILIEPNRLFRDGLKHLLNGTRFEVGAEFNTVDLALTAAETDLSELMIPKYTAEPLTITRAQFAQAFLRTLARRVIRHTDES